MKNLNKFCQNLIHLVRITRLLLILIKLVFYFKLIQEFLQIIWLLNLNHILKFQILKLII